MLGRGPLFIDISRMDRIDILWPEKRSRMWTIDSTTHREALTMELLIPPRHREQFGTLKEHYATGPTKIGPITWNGYLRVRTDDQRLIDALKQQLDAQPE